jgi:hypothetical protein
VLIGAGKGLWNAFIDDVVNLGLGDGGGRVPGSGPGVDLHAQASSETQAAVMGVVQAGAPVVLVLTGGKGEVLPNEAMVVRGGVEVRPGAIGTHPTAGVTGVSVESAAGKSVPQLATESPTVRDYGKIRCCTVGEVRAAGGDVVITPGKSPNHATLTGLTAEAINTVLKPRSQTRPGEKYS